MRLFLFILVGFSITHTLVFLHVCAQLRLWVSGLKDHEFEFMAKNDELKGFRQNFLGRLFRCHACMGFWIGSFLSRLFGGFITDYVDMSSLLVTIGDGFLLLGMNFILWVVLRRLGAEEL